MKPHPKDTTALETGLTSLAHKAKTGEFLTTRTYVIFGVVLFLGAAIGYWWYAAGEAHKAAAVTWTELDSLTGPSALADFAKNHPNDLPGRIARLQEARIWLGPEGIDKLAARIPEDRNKGIESIEKARTALLKLAEEFKDDLTLQAQCLDAAAHAELSLVGIPKDGKVDDYRGTVDEAAKLFRKLAALVGESNPVGEKVTKKAADLEARKQEITRDAQALNNQFPSFTMPTLKLPNDPLRTDLPPLPPTSAIPAPKPPENITPPAANVNPPATTKSPVAPTPPPATNKAPVAPTPPGTKK